MLRFLNEFDVPSGEFRGSIHDEPLQYPDIIREINQGLS
jgi:hypothetical protein